MNNEIEARPFEEYKEMIRSMPKEEMIKGLYDLSKSCIEKGNEIERLNENNQAMQMEMAKTWDKLQQKENIIKEVRELLKRYQNNEYYYKYNGKYLKSEIKEDILEILDKENEENGRK